MVEFKSPLGRTNFNSEANENRVWTVDDASDGRFDIPQNAVMEQGSEISAQEAMARRQQFMEQARQQQQQRSVGNKRRIEILLEIARGTKHVELETESGVIVFSLRTLKGTEQLEVAEFLENAKRIASNGVMTLTPTGQYNLRVLVLKHSLYAIDNIDLDVILGTSNIEDNQRILYRKRFIEELDGTLIGRLFSEYEILMSENQAKYGIKTEADAKEVSEEVAKSS